MSKLVSLVDFVRSDMMKLLRYAAVSAITVPLGLLLIWACLDVLDMQPVVANIVGTSLATFPNYLLNRYWVWNKRGANSVGREIAPFWAMAFLGALLSSIFVAIANQFTDRTVIFLAANLFAFGMVWVLKFFVLETYLFAETTEQDRVAT